MRRPATDRHFELRVLDVECDASVTSIAAARWPSLEALVIAPCDVPLAALGPLLAAAHVPRLRHLTLTLAPDRIWEALAASKLLPQLESLAVSTTPWPGDADPDGWRQHPAFRHLQRLNPT